MKTTVIALPLLLTFAAHAQVLQTSPVTVTSPSSGTAALNTITTLSIPQFNVAGGTLQSISLTFLGSLTGGFKIENLDVTSASGNNTITGTYVLKRPDTTVISTVNPQVSNTKTLTGFDGVIDFAGSSGFTFPDTTVSASSNQSLTSGTDLSLFTGSGNVNLSVAASAVPAAPGIGNGLTQSSALGFASATVTYNYTVAVPEPEEYAAAVGLALVGFAAWRRRAARR